MMFAGIDVGGTKTLIASVDGHGVIQQKIKFPTSQDYSQFLTDLRDNLKQLGQHEYAAAGMAIPGRIDRAHGIGRRFGNLPWTDVPIQHDIEQILGCPLTLEHDPSLAALSEAMLVKNISKVLYVTISTGIGAGLIIDGIIDRTIADSEAGQMVIEHHGKHEAWEHFASGSAIVRRFGKMAKDIDDEATWQTIARDIASGMQELIALTEPDLLIIGGSVGRYFDKFGKLLESELKRIETPMVPTPPLKAAERPDDAVVYGCFDLAKMVYIDHHHTAAGRRKRYGAVV